MQVYGERLIIAQLYSVHRKRTRTSSQAYLPVVKIVVQTTDESGLSKVVLLLFLVAKCRSVKPVTWPLCVCLLSSSNGLLGPLSSWRSTFSLRLLDVKCRSGLKQRLTSGPPLNMAPNVEL